MARNIAQARSLDAARADFMLTKARIDALLAGLAARSAEHFDAEPDTLHWGHVGTLGRIEQLLLEVAETAGACMRAQG